MFGTRTTVATVVALTLGALGVIAETPEEYLARFKACTATLAIVGDNPVFYFESDDETYFQYAYRYDNTVCNSSIKVNSLRLQDNVDSTIYNCQKEEFSPDRSTITATCTLNTRGSMARAARDDGHDDYSTLLSVGDRTKGITFQQTQFFMVEPPPAPPAEETPAPTPSGSFQKRRSIESQHKFDCPTGHTYCWTGERQEYACMDTSSDVTACGRCPYAAGNDKSGGDCTSIEGADDVQCLRSKCVVNACERGFQVSLDRTKCLDGSKRSIMSRGILF